MCGGQIRYKQRLDVINRVLELLAWSILIGVGIVKLHELPDGSVPVIDRLDELRCLFGGGVLGIDGRERIKQLQQLRCGNLQCNQRLDVINRVLELLGWSVLIGVGIVCLHELPDGSVPVIDGLDELL